MFADFGAIVGPGYRGWEVEIKGTHLLLVSESGRDSNVRISFAKHLPCERI